MREKPQVALSTGQGDRENNFRATHVLKGNSEKIWGAETTKAGPASAPGSFSTNIDRGPLKREWGIGAHLTS